MDIRSTMQRYGGRTAKTLRRDGFSVCAHSGPQTRIAPCTYKTALLPELAKTPPTPSAERTRGAPASRAGGGKTAALRARCPRARTRRGERRHRVRLRRLATAELILSRHRERIGRAVRQGGDDCAVHSRLQRHRLTARRGGDRVTRDRAIPVGSSRVPMPRGALAGAQPSPAGADELLLGEPPTSACTSSPAAVKASNIPARVASPSYTDAVPN